MLFVPRFSSCAENSEGTWIAWLCRQPVGYFLTRNDAQLRQASIGWRHNLLLLSSKTFTKLLCFPWEFSQIFIDSHSNRLPAGSPAFPTRTKTSKKRKHLAWKGNAACNWKSSCFSARENYITHQYTLAKGKFTFFIESRVALLKICELRVCVPILRAKVVLICAQCRPRVE